MASLGWRLSTLGLALTLIIPATVFAAPVFSDGAESGTLLRAETPAGSWDAYTVVGSQTMAVTPAAAREGGWGLRFTDADGTPRAAGHQTRVIAQLTSAGPDLYFRAWVRLVDTNQQGDIDFVWTGPFPNVSLILLFPGAVLAVGGVSDLGNDIDRTEVNLSTSRWHLLEWAVRGLESSTGIRQVWLDGALVHARDAVWSAASWRPTDLSLGGAFINSGELQLVMDFDNVRVDTAPMASRLLLRSEDPAPAGGDCHRLEVALRDSVTVFDVPAPARVDVALSTAGAALGLFADAACSQPLEPSSVALLPGQAQRALYVSVGAEGVMEVTAQTLDLLPAQLSLAVERPGARRDLGVQMACAQGAGAVSGLLWLLVSLVPLLFGRVRRARVADGR